MPEVADIVSTPLDADHTLHYRDSNHEYICSGPTCSSERKWKTGQVGERWIGGSSIPKVEFNDPGGLMTWAHKLGEQGKSHTEAKDWSAASGKLVHLYLEHLAGTGPFEPDGVDERTKGCMEAVTKWWLKEAPQVLESEQIVGSVTHKFAGTLDQIAIVRDEMCMVDLKTCDETTDLAKYRQYNRDLQCFVQMAGYDIAQYEMTERELKRRYLLLASATGDYWFVPDLIYIQTERAFLSKLALYKQDKAMQKAYVAALKEASNSL